MRRFFAGAPSHPPVERGTARRRGLRSGPRFFLALLLLSAAPVFAAPEPARRDISPVNLLERALEAYLQERYDESISLFQQVLEYDRRNETAQQGLDNALRQKKQKLQAERDREGPALDAARNFVQHESYVEAVDRLHSILERVPDHPQARELSAKIKAKVKKRFTKAKFQSSDWFYYKGVLAYIDGDWYQASEAWEQVYAFNPDRISLLAQIDQAKQNLEQQQRTERIALYQNVAWDNLKQSHYQEAINAWQEVLKIDAANVEAQEGIKQAEDAKSKDVVKRRQEDLQTYSQKAMDAYIEREYTKSMDLWKEVLDLDPDNTLAQDYVKRIQSRTQTARDYKTPDYYNGRGGFASPNPVSGFTKAQNLLKEERYPEAIESLERYTNRNPDDQKAKDALSDARSKQKSLSEKAYNEGLVAYSQGKPGEAIKAWQACLRINPDYQKARQALIKSLSEAKRR